MRTRVLTLGAVLAASLALPTAPAGANTSVEVDGNDVVIEVVVDCVGCKGRRGPDGSRLAKYWEKTAEDAWNAAFDKFSYCNKYKLSLDVKIRARGDDFGAKDGRHRILVGEPGSGLSQTGWDGVFEPTPGGDPGQRSPDGTRYYRNDADGAMPADATPTVIIHEFGHVMGLGDDRDDMGNALPNRDRTMMVGGGRLPDGTVITPDTELRIDKNLVDRIGDQLANLGDIECGETWRGSITGTGENVGVCPQNIDFSGSFVIRVRSDGTAALNGHFGNVNNGACGGGGESFEADFRLDGTKTRRAFRFPQSAVFPWPVHLRISGDRATGSISKMFGPVYLTSLEFRVSRSENGRAVG